MSQADAYLIWKIADLRRGTYQPNEYREVNLPFKILRRLDCVLELTKVETLAEYKKIQVTWVDPAVMQTGRLKMPFYNASRWTFAAHTGGGN